MILQMKGASVSTSNSSSFGSVTSVNEAGNYELAKGCFLNENKRCKKLLLKARAVQVVRYQNNKRIVLQHIGSAHSSEDVTISLEIANTQDF
jgi:hypothetical protein